MAENQGNPQFLEMSVYQSSVSSRGQKTSPTGLKAEEGTLLHTAEPVPGEWPRLAEGLRAPALFPGTA